MAECEWAILCDYTFRDERRKICVIGIFDRMFTQRVPATHHQTALALRFVGDAHEKFSFRVEILRPTGGVIGTLRGEGDLGDAGSLDVNFNIPDLPIPDYGHYAFQVYVNDQASKAATFTVAKTPESTSTPQS